MNENIPHTVVPVKRPYDNFVVLRLIMSLIVLVTHFKVLSGGMLLNWLPTSPEFAVAGFFVISGYVITASYDKLPVMVSFYAKRIFRMYPLYVVIIIAQTIGMSLFFLHDPGSHAHGIARYLGTNLLMLNFLQYDIGGLLAHARNPGINPSLWTLKIEIMFYAVVPLLCLCFYRFRLKGLVVLYVLSVLYTEYMLHTGHVGLAKQLPGAIRLIVVGMALYFYRRKLQVPVWIAMPVCILGFVLLEFRNGTMHPALFPLLAGPIVILCATRIPFPRPKTDLSYGVYLLHAPLIQFSLLTGIFRDTYWFLALLVATCCGLAYIGYKFIELPGVSLGHFISDYVARTAIKSGLVNEQEPAKDAAHALEAVKTAWEPQQK